MRQIQFNTTCPICNRKLFARLELLGDEVRCGHCHGCFVAFDTSQAEAQRTAMEVRVDAILSRVGLIGHVSANHPCG